MNINTNSWHYRLVNKFCDMWRVNNLCPYMRRLTGILVVIVFVIPSVLFGMANTIVLIVKGREVLDTLLLNFGGDVFHYYGVACTVFGMVAWLLVLGYLLVTLVLYVVGKVAKALDNNESYQSWRYDKAQRSMLREPNIFITWCKARHDQVCPMVDFVAEEKTE